MDDSRSRTTREWARPRGRPSTSTPVIGGRAREGREGWETGRPDLPFPSAPAFSARSPHKGRGQFPPPVLVGSHASSMRDPMWSGWIRASPQVAGPPFCWPVPRPTCR